MLLWSKNPSRNKDKTQPQFGRRYSHLRFGLICGLLIEASFSFATIWSPGASAGWRKNYDLACECNHSRSSHAETSITRPSHSYPCLSEIYTPAVFLYRIRVGIHICLPSCTDLSPSACKPPVFLFACWLALNAEIFQFIEVGVCQDCEDLTTNF